MDRYDPYTDKFLRDTQYDILSTNLAEVGTDTINRQAAIDVLDAYQVKIENGEENPYAWARLRMSELPPAQPERIKGHWIDAVIPNDNGGLPVQVCDQCNTFFPLAYTGGGHSFCPNCGADMRGEQDG